MTRLCLLLFVLLASLCAHAQTPDQEVRAGVAALDRNDWQNAKTHFDRALRFDPDDASAWHGRGVAELELHQWQAAKDDLDRALELDPRDAGAFAARGMARKALGDYDGLVADAAQAAKLNPDDYGAMEDDAHSTVLYRRMMLVFLVLAGVLVCAGAFPLARSLLRITRAGG